MVVSNLSNSFNPVPKVKCEKIKVFKSIRKKSRKMAKLERDRVSILQNDSSVCFLCGRKLDLDKHEAFGGCNRRKSIEWKLIFYLCRRCHSKAELDLRTEDYLHNYAKDKFIDLHSKELFLEEFGKNYIRG